MTMRTRITCCKDCNKRTVGCHSTCDDYIRQNDELNEFRAAQRAETDAAKELREYHKHNDKRRPFKKATAKDGR